MKLIGKLTEMPVLMKRSNGESNKPRRYIEVSGRSKPPFVVSGIQLCVIPGQVPGDPMVLF